VAEFKIHSEKSLMNEALIEMFFSSGRPLAYLRDLSAGRAELGATDAPAFLRHDRATRSARDKL
jgi:hypothetical protein